MSESTTSDVDASTGRPGRSKVTVFIVASIAYALAIPFSLGDDSLGLLIPSLLLCALSLYSFFFCGARYITASAATSYGTLIFLGFPGVYASLGLYSSPKAYTQTTLLLAISLAFIFQMMVLVTSVSPGNARDAAIAKSTPGLSRKGRSSADIGLFLALAAFIAHLIFRQFGISTGEFAFGWIALLFAALVAINPDRNRFRFLGVLLLIAVFYLVYGSDIGGFGRLNLAVLAMSVAVLAALWLRTWWVKILAVVVTAPALVYLGNQRLQFIQQELGRVPGGDEGLGSVVGPLFSSATIVGAVQEGEVNLSWGHTVFVAAFSWVPRVIWESKPAGLGREIVPITQPWLAASPVHSDAATVVGEAVWNFGFWGSPLFFVVAVAFIRFLDKKILVRTGSPKGRREAMAVMIYAILAGSMMNFVWGGTFTMVTRFLAPIAVLLLLLLITRTRSSPHRSRRADIRI